MIEFTINTAQVIGLLAGVILPVLVGLVTTRVTHGGVKAGLLAVLSVATNIFTELGESLINETTYDLGTALVAGLGTFVIAVSTHYGLLKPTGVSAKAQSVGSRKHLI